MKMNTNARKASELLDVISNLLTFLFLTGARLLISAESQEPPAQVNC